MGWSVDDDVTNDRYRTYFIFMRQLMFLYIKTKEYECLYNLMPALPLQTSKLSMILCNRSFI